MGIWRARFFKPEEFTCKCGCATPEPILANLESLAWTLEWGLRIPLGRPITVFSGYRCPGHNRLVGGAHMSFHLEGKAADMRAKDTHPQFLAGFIEAQIAAGELPEGGVGTYMAHDGLHYDMRGKKARWRQ